MEQVASAVDSVVLELESRPAVEKLRRWEVEGHSSVVELGSDGAAAAAAEVSCPTEEFRKESLCADRFGVPYQLGMDGCACRWVDEWSWRKHTPAQGRPATAA